MENPRQNFLMFCIHLQMKKMRRHKFPILKDHLVQDAGNHPKSPNMFYGATVGASAANCNLIKFKKKIVTPVLNKSYCTLRLFKVVY